MLEQRPLLMLAAFLGGSALFVLGAGYLVIGSLPAALVPAFKAWAIGALAGAFCFARRENYLFAGAVLAVAAFFFLVPYISLV